jgi:hypothetical protein
VEVSVAIQGAQEPDQPPGFEVEGAQLQYVGPSKQATLINFQLSVSMSHRYMLTPSRIGDITIPSVALQIRGKRYETQPVTLKVTAASPESGQPPPGPSPLVECEIPRRPVYVGESFPVQVRLLVPSETPWRIERLPQFETDAFTKTPFQQPQQQQQVRDGRPFDTLFFPTALTAIKSGEVPLGPVQFKIQVATPQKKQPNRGPFGGIFNGFPFANQQNTFQEKTIILPQHKMQVQELPTEGRPASFRGAIGVFNFRSSFNQDRVKMGEPIVVTLSVEGQGNFDRIEAPPIAAPEGWRVYPPEIHFAKGDEFGLRGTKTFRIAVVPQSAQTQMPEFEFASFNPDAGTYHVQKSLSAPLRVEGSLDKSQMDALAGSLPPKKSQRSAETSPGTGASTTVPALLEENVPSLAVSELWRNRPLFWSLQASLVFAVLAGVAWQWNLRRIAALGPVPRLLEEARSLEQRLGAENSKTSWFQQAKRVVQLHTAARSGLMADAVDLPETLHAFNPPTQIADDLRWIFETDAALRFGGVRSDLPLNPEERERIQNLLRHLTRETV